MTAKVLKEVNFIVIQKDYSDCNKIFKVDGHKETVLLEVVFIFLKEVILENFEESYQDVFSHIEVINIEKI